jgi:thiol-disulfide isomerase/thioredoxin
MPHAASDYRVLRAITGFYTAGKMIKRIGPRPPATVRRSLGRLLLLFILGALGTGTLAVAQPRLPPGPPLYLPAGLDWLNVPGALTPGDLKGKVVILDFWTYGCVNCINVAEELRRLEDRFGNRLVVIGVHSPKFDHEKNLEALRSMVVRLDRRHPIVSDPDWTLMEHYGVRAWPTLALFAPDGSWVGKVSGEGQEGRLARAIDRLLELYRADLSDRPLPLSLEKERFAAALLAAPGKVAISDDGARVAVSDTLHHRVILARSDGQILRTFGSGQPGWRDGEADEAQFWAPQGLAFSTAGLLVADAGSHTVRSIDPDTGQVRTLAGTGRAGLARRDGEHDALHLDLRSPWDLAVRGGQVFIAMAGSHQIWRLGLGEGKISAYAGSGREGIATGPLREASFSQPSGLALRGEDLYVADAEASAIRRIHLDAGRVENLVGTGLFDFGDRDGPLAEAALQHPSGIASLGPGRLAIADTYNHKVKLLDLEAGTLTTLLGTGRPGRRIGSRGDTELNEPGGLAVADGRILVADTNNHRILSLRLDSGQVAEWRLRE